MAVKKNVGKSTQKKASTDSSAEFEKLLKKVSKADRFVLRLFVTGNTVRSGQAIANVRALCEDYLAGRYDLEVVDIYQQPKTAAKEQIIAAPTLIKELPVPARRLIGDLSDRDKVIVGLDLMTAGGPEQKGGRTHWVKL